MELPHGISTSGAFVYARARRPAHGHAVRTASQPHEQCGECQRGLHQGSPEQVCHDHALGFAGWNARKATTQMTIPFVRSLTPQTARKAECPQGCNINGCSRRCTPWHRTSSTTCVVRLAIIPFMLTTWLMADLFRVS